MGATNSTPKETVLETARGRLRGLTQIDNTTNLPVLTRYTRIPYALPPIGPLRFRRPVPLPEDFLFDDGQGDAGHYTKFGNACPQPSYAHSSAALDNPDSAKTDVWEQSEDCLFLNIWVPGGSPPVDGWPVQFYIHGGWLQVGDAMQTPSHDPFDLMKRYPRIIVAPTYRLNIFGFLACDELKTENGGQVTGNFGFWDQRAALEWTYDNISLFGGDPSNISVGGLSAGAHSAIFQLHYDTYLPDDRRLINKIYLYSNAVGIQPKPTTGPESRAQFEELCLALNIPSQLPGPKKLEALRSVPEKEIVDVITKLTHHTFRATTDNNFISANFLRSIHDGTFTFLLSHHNIKILLGEVADEGLLYKLVNPPSSLEALQLQLNNYYPSPVTTALLSPSTNTYILPSGTAAGAEAWADIYGRILGDCQVHASIRGFARSLLSAPTPLPVSSVLRYRIEWRAKGLDAWIDRSVGCCHASDVPIWSFSGKRAGFTAEDERTAEQLLEPFYAFLKGGDMGWGTGSMSEIKVVGADGKVEVMEDKLWEEGLRVWDVMAKAQGM